MSRFDYVSNAANGYEAQDVLQTKLWNLRKAGDLALVVKHYRAGDPAALNAEQFYAPFMIQFDNGLRWVVFSTTSCRSDRIKGQQWDADNLKRLDTSIVRAVITYPDDTSYSEKCKFNAQKAKYDSRQEISRIDDIVSHEDLMAQISKYALELYNSIASFGQDESYDGAAEEENKEYDVMFGDGASHVDNASDAEASLEGVEVVEAKPEDAYATLEANVRDVSEVGREYDFNGRAFERDIATLLQSSKYLDMMKRGQANNDDVKYACFVKMINVFGIDIDKVVRIEANAEKEVIGLLPNGGQPKTDVVAKVVFDNDEERLLTISCKRTTCNFVSVHQYTADTFADVLAPSNNALRQHLKEFQYYANCRDMPREQRDALERELAPLLKPLCDWVVCGIGAAVNDPCQYADYLVVYNPIDGRFAAHSASEYIAKLLQATPKAFGTPFGWTYASKQRQKSIQLKLPIIW